MKMVKQTVICVRHDVIAVQVLKSRAGNGRRRRPWAPTAPRGGELRLEPASPPCPSQWGWTLPCPGQWWQRPSCLQGLASPQVSSHPGFQKLLPWPPPSFSCPAVPRVPVPRCVYLSQARESPRSSLGQKSLFYSPPPPPLPGWLRAPGLCDFRCHSGSADWEKWASESSGRFKAHQPGPRSTMWHWFGVWEKKRGRNAIIYSKLTSFLLTECSSLRLA